MRSAQCMPTRQTRVPRGHAAMIRCCTYLLNFAGDSAADLQHKKHAGGQGQNGGGERNPTQAGTTVGEGSTPHGLTQEDNAKVLDPFPASQVAPAPTVQDSVRTARRDGVSRDARGGT